MYLKIQILCTKTMLQVNLTQFIHMYMVFNYKICINYSKILTRKIYTRSNLYDNKNLLIVVIRDKLLTYEIGEERESCFSRSKKEVWNTHFFCWSLSKAWKSSNIHREFHAIFGSTSSLCEMKGKREMGRYSSCLRVNVLVETKTWAFTNRRNRRIGTCLDP